MNNIRELRKKKGITQEELGSIIGVGKATISNYESEKRQLTADILQKLAEFFDVSTDEILGITTKEASPDPGWKTVDPQNFPPRHSVSVPIPDLQNETALIPVLGSVRAGYDNYIDQNIEGWVNVEPQLKSSHPRAYALRVKGDSMEPDIRHGDFVICLPDAEVRSNNIAIVCINGDIGTVKRVRIDPDGLTLIPSNPKYRPVHYSPEDVESFPVTILSKVDEIRRKA